MNCYCFIHTYSVVALRFPGFLVKIAHTFGDLFDRHSVHHLRTIRMEHDGALLHLFRLHHVQIQNHHVLIKVVLVVVVVIVLVQLFRAVGTPKLANARVDNAKADDGGGKEEFGDVRCSHDLFRVVSVQVQDVQESIVEFGHEQVSAAHIQTDFEEELESA